MREWWRWTLRGVAVLALVAGGVLVALHPVVRVPSPIIFPLGNYPAPTTQCLSPFDRLTGEMALLSPRDYGYVAPGPTTANTSPRLSEAVQSYSSLCPSFRAEGRWRRKR